MTTTHPKAGSRNRRGGLPAGTGRGVPRAFLASLLLHGALAAGLGAAWAREPGKPPNYRIDAALETPIVLDGEIDPIPEFDPPELPAVPRADESGLVESEPVEMTDHRFSPAAAVGEEPSEGGTTLIGIGGGGPRFRPRRAAEAAAVAVPAVGGGIVAPAPAGPSVRARPLPDACEEPAYPSRERRLGIEGVVLLFVRIDLQGAVGGVDVLETSGAVALDLAAVDAVLGWKFSPALRDGTPVDDAIRLRVTFSLVDGGRVGAER